MADKSIDQLNEAEKIYATDLFVLQQSGSAKKLTGQVLLNWLTAAADGHGGIQSIEKLSTSGLADTYRITLADTTTFDFVVNNGRSITGISKTGTSGLVDTYTISYNNGTTSTFTVRNGEKGDKGDNAYVWIKYASQEPTESSHSMGDIPDNWIGIYSGNASTTPTDWKQYKWFKHKGEKGNTGDPATIASQSVTYQVSDSGTIIPSGTWGTSVPVVAQGKYLWTKTELKFNTGDPIVSYSVARMGVDGTGSVSSVAGVSPEPDGNVLLSAADVGALATSGGDMAGEIRMNGQPISGLNDPTEANQAARKGYVDAAIRKAAPRNLLDNSDFQNPVNQRGKTSYAGAGYTIDRWIASSAQPVRIGSDGITLDGTNGNIVLRQRFESLRDGIYTLAIKVGDYINVRQYKKVGTTYTNVYQNNSYDGGYVTLLNNSGTPEFQFRANSGNIITAKWAALYEGEYTAETLPEYQPKGYAAELAECQRYYYKVPSAPTISYNGYIFSSTVCRVTIPLPVPMRVKPTLSIESLSTINMYSGVSGNSISSITIGDVDSNASSLICTGSYSSYGIPVVLRFNTIVELSADL